MLKILVLATLAGKVLAQSSVSTGSTAAGGLPQLPSCAQKCLGEATAQQSSCNSIDAKCLCQNLDYDHSLSCCIYQNCNAVDQRTALAFNVAECANVNVAIPDFIGCINSTSSSAGPSASTTVLGAISVATTAVAAFTGGNIFTGSCTTAQFASASLAAGGILEYPWLGCSNQEPGCCPFDIKVGGALSVCPQDYVTTSGACCPSGWSIYASTIAGETPCVTSPSKPLAAPTSNPSSSASVSVITSQQFTLKYTLATKSSSSLPTGAIAGIAVGAAVAIAFLAALLTLFIRKRRSKALIERDAATVKSPTGAGYGPFSEDPNSPMSQMTGPGYPAQTNNRPEPLSWTNEPPTPATPLNPVGGVELPADEAKPTAPPIEMMGDMYIDEHHPAYSPPPQNPPLSPPLSEMHADEVSSAHDGKRDTIASVVSEAESPVYSPVGGSALLPDSPHLNGGFVTERVEELEKAEVPTEEEDHNKF